MLVYLVGGCWRHFWKVCLRQFCLMEIFYSNILYIYIYMCMINILHNISGQPSVLSFCGAIFNVTIFLNLIFFSQICGEKNVLFELLSKSGGGWLKRSKRIVKSKQQRCAPSWRYRLGGGACLLLVLGPLMVVCLCLAHFAILLFVFACLELDRKRLWGASDQRVGNPCPHAVDRCEFLDPRRRGHEIRALRD